MNYYLGEIFVTHKRVFCFWIEYTEKLSITLIKADNWSEANRKCKLWAEERTRDLKNKFKTKYFTTPSI